MDLATEEPLRSVLHTERLAENPLKVISAVECASKHSRRKQSADEVLSHPVPDQTCLPCIKMRKCIKTGDLQQLSEIGLSSPVINHLGGNVMSFPL